MDKIKKIGKLWATDRTINNSSLSQHIVECLEHTRSTPVMMKTKSVEYEVYGKNRNEYKELIEKIKINLRGHRNEI